MEAPMNVSLVGWSLGTVIVAGQDCDRMSAADQAFSDLITPLGISTGTSRRIEVRENEEPHTVLNKT
jgi:hypothetical protein